MEKVRRCAFVLCGKTLADSARNWYQLGEGGCFCSIRCAARYGVAAARSASIFRAPREAVK